VGARLLGQVAGGSLAYHRARRFLSAGPGRVRGLLLVSERSRQGGVSQQLQIALASLKKRVLGIGETLASSLVGLATTLARKIAAYTFRPSWSTGVLGRAQGRIKDLWA